MSANGQVRESRVGQLRELDKGDDAVVLMIQHWNEERGFGFATDGSSKIFVSGKAHHIVKQGQTVPGFGVKQPAAVTNGTDIIAVVHSDENNDGRLYAAAWCTCAEYEMAEDLMKASRRGESLQMDGKDDGFDCRILSIQNWVGDRGFGFASDGKQDIFVSAGAHRELVPGRNFPSFGDKLSLTVPSGTDIVATIHEGNKGLYVGSWATLGKYEEVAETTLALPIYQVCKVTRVRDEEPTVLVFIESRSKSMLLHAYENIMKDVKAFSSDGLGYSAIFRKRNDHGDWVKCPNPFAEKKETVQRPTGTTKAGPKKGQVRSVKPATAQPKAKKARGQAANKGGKLAA